VRINTNSNTKRTFVLICLALVLRPVCGARFQNLDFDAGHTNITVSIPRDEGDGYGPIGDLLPGWRLLQGTNDVSLIGLNLNPIGLGVASIYNANFQGVGAPVFGNYSLGLYPGYNLLFQYRPFSLVQQGDVGPEVRSIRFFNFGSPVELRLNGTMIPLSYDYQPGGTDPNNRLAVVTGDVSAFAGQTVELKFTTLDINNSAVNWLDSIEFTAQIVPEPATVVLLSLGFLMLGRKLARRLNS
jgi:hypothetical protein